MIYLTCTRQVKARELKRQVAPELAPRMESFNVALVGGWGGSMDGRTAPALPSSLGPEPTSTKLCFGGGVSLMGSAHCNGQDSQED